MNFITLKTAVAKQFDHMQKSGKLFTVSTEDSNTIWDVYLEAFPAGSNPIYRERTDHDCSCCKSFIRAVGGVITLIDGKVESVWDIAIPDEPEYQQVADALAAKVKALPIQNVFLTDQRVAGVNYNFEEITGASPKKWDHFFVNIPQAYQLAKDQIGPKLGESRATFDVIYRSLTEISNEALDTVLELIAQNSLYRGEESKAAVVAFRNLKKDFDGQDSFVWNNLNPAFRIRNTAIGTLLVDLSEGKDLDYAVKSFEAKVAPTNYKRPTALITQRMVDEAKSKLEELGLTSAIRRRHAHIGDITINNVLFADRSTKLEADVFDALATAATKKPNLAKVDEVPIETFLKDVLPSITGLEVMVENRHKGNFVSLIAPEDPTAGDLFKWPNNFSWAYAGDVTDSIKERVKQAGGNVEGEFCCRLAWFNHDDLDLHMEESRHHIYFGNRSRLSPEGGKLDVDMNAGCGTTREPVENIFYKTIRTMSAGVYTLYVNQYMRRETADVGFEVEVDICGVTQTLSYPKLVSGGENIEVATFEKFADGRLVMTPKLEGTTRSTVKWGVTTGKFQKVRIIMNSPNYWDDKATGNKHYFFVLDGCVNDERARGFFNEFLKEELTPHRKVFETLGSKLLVPDSLDQLSGLGFSSTQRSSLLCRVSGSFTRTINITF